MATGLFSSVLPLREFAPLMAEVAKDIFVNNEPCVFHLNTNVGLSFSTTGAASAISTNGNFDQFISTVGASSDQVVCVNMALRAPNQNPQWEVTFTTNDNIVGQFNFSNPQNDSARTTRAIAALTKHLRLTPYAALIASTSSQAEQTALQIRERAASDLHEALAKFNTALIELETKQAASHQKAREELDRVYTERQTQLDEEDRKRRETREAHDRARDEAFEQRVADHNKEVAKFNTNQARYERRGLLTRVEDVLVRDLAISTSTVHKRRPVELACWWLMAAAGAAILGLVTYRLIWGGDWRLAVPIATCSTVLLTTFVYYTKWADRWFREHADAEFASRRYQADILRASWIAELAAEWSETHEGAALQSEIVTAFTRGLFADVGASHETEHPMEHLMSLMKRATEINIGGGKSGVFSVRASAETPPLRSAARASSE